MFQVAKVYYPTANHDRKEGYQIESELKESHLFWVNKFLHFQSNSSINTARQYAYRLNRFMNYLDTKGKNIYTATNTDLKNFVTAITIKTEDNTLIVGDGAISESTLKSYLMTLKRFYVFLIQQDQDFLISLEESTRPKDKHSLLYGNVFEETTYEFLVNPSAFPEKHQKDYERWYTEDQIEAILSAFTTERDQAIFSLTLDGLRIDEALSARLADYNPMGQELKLTRSKGKTKTNARTVILSPRTIELINSYLFHERDIVESEMLEEGKLCSPNLFINLARRKDSYGKEISYSSWYQILKRAAKKAGLDPKRIRTHSGRSTRAQELFNLQSRYPEKLNDEQIKLLMGWSNLDSAAPYKNTLDRETALNNINIIRKLEEGTLDENL